MANDDKMRVLYDAVGQHYDLGEYEEFKAKMGDGKKRRAFYDAVSQRYDLGSYEDFNRKLGGEVRYDFTRGMEPESAKVARAMRHMGATEAQTPAPQTPAPRPPKGGGPSTESTGTVMPKAGETPQVAAPKAGETGKGQWGGIPYMLGMNGQDDMPPTAAQQRAAMARVQGTLASSQAAFDASNERMQNLVEYTQKNGGRPSGRLVETGNVRVNPESGKVEKEVLTPQGSRTHEGPLAEMEAADYAGRNELQMQLAQAREKKKEIEQRIVKRSQELADEAATNTSHRFVPGAGAIWAPQYNPDSSTGGDGDGELTKLYAAIGDVNDLIKTLEEEQDRRRGVDVGFWRGFGRAVSNPRAWDFGVSDLASTKAKMAYNDNRSQGEQQAADLMMEAAYSKQDAESTYGGNASAWNRFGVIAGEALPFMADFMMSGGGLEGITAFSNIAGKAGARLAAKWGLEEGMKAGIKSYIKREGVKQGLMSWTKQQAAPWAIKALGTTADDLLVRAPIMTNTIQGAKTAADIAERKLGDVVEGESGKYDFENKRNWSSAIWQGEANAVIENFSEMFGAHLPGAKEVAEMFGAKKISGLLAKAESGELGAIVGTTSKFLQKAGVSDYFGEVSEEYYGQLWRTMLGLDDAYRQNPDGTRTNLLLTGEWHGDIWGGMALSIGMMHGAGAPLSAARYTKLRHGVNKADARASVLLTPEIWEPLRARIDGTTNDDIDELATTIIADKELSDKEKTAVMEYMERSLYLRGYNLSSVVAGRGKPLPDNQLGLELGYDRGYGLDEEQTEEVQNQYVEARAKAVEFLGADAVDAIDADPYGQLQSHAGKESEQAVLDYLNIKAVWEGAMDRRLDDKETAIARSDAEVDAVVNRDSGKLQRATLKEGDREVYIVSGNVAAREDGSVDKEASEGMLVVRDAQTGKLQTVAPADVLSLDEAMDAEAVKAERRQQIEMERAVKTQATQTEEIKPAGEAAGAVVEPGGETPGAVAGMQGSIDERVDALPELKRTTIGKVRIGDREGEIRAKRWADGYVHVEFAGTGDIGVEADASLFALPEAAEGKKVEVTSLSRVPENEGRWEATIISNEGEERVVETVALRDGVSVDDVLAPYMVESAQADDLDGGAAEHSRMPQQQAEDEAPRSTEGGEPTVGTAAGDGDGQQRPRYQKDDVVTIQNDRGQKVKVKVLEMPSDNNGNRIWVMSQDGGYIRGSRQSAQIPADEFEGMLETPQAQAQTEAPAHPAESTETGAEAPGTVEPSELMDPQVQQENETQAPTDEQDGPKLSTEEKDLNERPFVLAKDETTTFGMIGAESGLTEAPIKLSQGENSTDESGRNHGYGLLHIEASHGDEIRAAGYSSVVEFVENVAKNYTDIREGAKIGDKQTYLLEVSDEHNNTLFVELSKDGSYWNVNSAGIFRKKYSRRKPKVHTVPAVGGGTVTDTPEVNSGQNEGATAPAGNSPWASEGKDTVSLEEKQGEEEKSSAQTEWDALVESYAGDEFTREEAAEMAQDHVAAEIDAAKKRLAAASKIKQGKNESTQDWIKRKRRAQKQAEADIASWEAMGKVQGQRQAQAEAERKAAEERAEAERQAAEAAAEEQRKAEQLRRSQEQAEAERQAAEAARAAAEVAAGVPDWTADNPENARKRGYRMVAGEKIERQQPMNIPLGKETRVDFSDEKTEKIPGRFAIVDLDETPIHASHIQGHKNPYHFIDEAQPKDRTDDISAVKAQQHARDFDVRKAMTDATAYVGPVVVNSRGEVVQGNGRRDMYEQLYTPANAAKAEEYRQALMAEAERYGRTAEEIARMKRPMAVRVIDVDDAEAIRLGQYTAANTESGGVERIMPQQTATKMGEEMRYFANLLLRSEDDEISMRQLIDRNGRGVLTWMRDKGYISATQYQSAFDSRGNVTAEAKNDLEKILYQAAFRGASSYVETCFERLPAKAQRAILSTAFRDMSSPATERMLDEIQASILAYSEMMASPTFSNKDVKTMESVLNALEGWKNELAIGDNGETVAPSEKYSNFALHLAALYRTNESTQKGLQSLFNRIYDLVQGTLVKEDQMDFGDVDNTPRTLAEAIKEVLDMEYQPAKNRQTNGNDGSNDVAGRDQGSTSGREGSPATPGGREQAAPATGAAERGGRTAADSPEVKEKPAGEEGPEAPTAPQSPKGGEAAEETPGAVTEAPKPVDVMTAAAQAAAEAERKAWETLLSTEPQRMSEVQKRKVAEAIEALDADEQEKERALRFLRGENTGAIARLTYNQLINAIKDAGDKTRAVQPDSGNADGAHVDERAAAATGSVESGRDGGQAVVLAEDTERQPDSGEDSGRGPADADGAQGHIDVAGPEPRDGDVRTGARERVGGSVDSDTGHERGSRPKNKRGSRKADGKNPGGRDSASGGSDTAVEKTKAGSDAAISALKDELSSLLDDFVNAKRVGRLYALPLPLPGLDRPERYTIAMKIIGVGAKMGYHYLVRGLTTLSAWTHAMHEQLAPLFRQTMQLTDEEVGRWIEEMWNSDYKLGDRVQTIAQWAAELGSEQLRKKVRMTLQEKRQLQAAAEGVDTKVCDIENIRESLPYLLEQQQDDVLRAETQFYDKSHADREHGYGKGYMFTNGTGTGKTYTGLGIVKRFVKQGKGRVLILTPSQKKVTDWINDGANLGLDVKALNGVKDKGTGVVITTYANMRSNRKVLEDAFDLVVYDESHKIMENQHGEETIGAKVHYMLTNKDVDHATERRKAADPWFQHLEELQEEVEQIKADVEAVSKAMGMASAAEQQKLQEKYVALQNELNEKSREVQALEPEVDVRTGAHRQKAEQEGDVERTKTVFLSATPFNVAESLAYAEGYIFSYPEENEATKGSSRHKSGRDQFMLDKFPAGYAFKQGKLQRTVQNAEALARQEVEFSDYLEEVLGTKSGRIIDSEWDYSRDFPTVTLQMADQFNLAVSQCLANVKLRPLLEYVQKTFFDYNYATALFEALKVSQIEDRIREHLAMGRKVVIFHRRKESKQELEPPFARVIRLAQEAANSTKEGGKREAIMKALGLYQQMFAPLLAWEQALDYRLPREQLMDKFGKDNVLLYSGTESKKKRDQAVGQFNDDTSGKDIIVIQEESGKEGISLHDTTGKHQRVLMSLALPVSPITALQIEGRIYRIGNESDAVIEYPILGLDSEIKLFAEKFNQRLSTTENLALGSKGRDLRTSFAKAVMERSGQIDLRDQGKGGKELDHRQQKADDFDTAITDYYGNQKLRAGKEREGVDYYPTPEPLGYKMAEWARMQEGESVLEPSAGHGAIARYVPREHSMTAIEPSAELYNKMLLKAGGPGRRMIQGIFEDYDIKNKHDVVLMNPPFGTAGATAIEHIKKAWQHLEEGGRLIAIVPRGAMDKKMNAWLDSTPAAVVSGEVQLPACAFGRAGTSVTCRVVVIDKVTSDEARRKMTEAPVQVDLSQKQTVAEMFEGLRHVEMPERKIDRVARVQKKVRNMEARLKDNKGFVKADVYEDDGRIYMELTGKKQSLYGLGTYDLTDSQGRRESLLKMQRKVESYRRNHANLSKYDGYFLDIHEEALKTVCEMEHVSVEDVEKAYAEQSPWWVLGELSADDKAVRDDIYNSMSIDEARQKVGAVYDQQRHTHGEEEYRRWRRRYQVAQAAQSDLRNGRAQLSIRPVDWSVMGELSDAEKVTVEQSGRMALATIKGMEQQARADIAKLEKTLEMVAGMGTEVEGGVRAKMAEAERKMQLLSLCHQQRKADIMHAASKYGMTIDQKAPLEKAFEMFKAMNQDSYNAALMERVMEKARSLNIGVILTTRTVDQIYGSYNHEAGMLELNANMLGSGDRAEMAQTILHEMIHAVTVYAISGYANQTLDSSSDLYKGAKTLVELHRLIGNDEQVKAYGATNAYELVAELSNPQFRAYLKAKKVWTQIVNAIKRILGFAQEGARESNALAEAEEALDKLLDNFDTLAWSRARRGRWGRIDTGVQKMAGEKGNTSVRLFDRYKEHARTPDMTAERWYRSVHNMLTALAIDTKGRFKVDVARDGEDAYRKALANHEPAEVAEAIKDVYEEGCAACHVNNSGRIYIFANQLNNATDVARAFYHEGGHNVISNSPQEEQYLGVFCDEISEIMKGSAQALHDIYKEAPEETIREEIVVDVMARVLSKGAKSIAKFRKYLKEELTKKLYDQYVKEYGFEPNTADSIGVGNTGGDSGRVHSVGETKEKDGESRDDIPQENEIGDAEAGYGGADGVAERKGRYSPKGHPSLFDDGSDATLPFEPGGETPGAVAAQTPERPVGTEAERAAAMAAMSEDEKAERSWQIEGEHQMAMLDLAESIDPEAATAGALRALGDMYQQMVWMHGEQPQDPRQGARMASLEADMRRLRQRQLEDAGVRGTRISFGEDYDEATQRLIDRAAPYRAELDEIEARYHEGEIDEDDYEALTEDVYVRMENDAAYREELQRLEEELMAERSVGTVDRAAGDGDTLHDTDSAQEDERPEDGPHPSKLPQQPSTVSDEGNASIRKAKARERKPRRRGGIWEPGMEVTTDDVGVALYWASTQMSEMRRKYGGRIFGAHLQYTKYKKDSMEVEAFYPETVRMIAQEGIVEKLKHIELLRQMKATKAARKALDKRIAELEADVAELRRIEADPESVRDTRHLDKDALTRVLYRKLEPITEIEGEPTTSQVEDAKTLEWLESLGEDDVVYVYRAMQLIDGKLYPPMAAVVEGEYVEPSELGRWEQADERPWLVDSKGNFKLQKKKGKKGPGEGDVPARYNPYIHTSRSMLNDQFSGASSRPNLVTVKVAIPKSELTSGYKAEKAKDAVGEMSWHSGPVSSQLAKLGKPRKVILTRYAKPVEIVDDREVAREIAKTLRGTGITVPAHTVTPSLRSALEAEGVKVVDSRSAEAKQAAAEELAAKLHTPVRIVDSAKAAEAGSLENVGDLSAKGWYDTATGEVVIVLDNNTDTADVAQTILHEVVAHKGLRELFGERFGQFVINVYSNVGERIRRQINEMAARNGWDIATATEEYMARLAERTDFEAAMQQGWMRRAWQAIKDAFMQMLSEAGVKLPRKLSDNELRYILWRSYQMQVSGGILGAAENVVMQQRLGQGRLYRRKDGGGTMEAPEPGKAREYYERRVREPNRSGTVKPLENLWWRLAKNYADSMAALKALMEGISLETGNEIEGYEDAYMAENRMASMNKTHQEEYERDYYLPVQRAIWHLMQEKADYSDIKNYMVAKHGLERNERLAMRDAVAAMENSPVKDRLDKAEGALAADPSNTDLQAMYNKAKAAYDKKLMEKYHELREKDYSGLTALTGESEVAEAEAEAARMVTEFEAAHDTGELWDAINAATKETLRCLYDAGLMSKNQYEHVQAMFSNYIPLRGWDDNVAGDEYNYHGSGRTSTGTPVMKTAKGRASLAEDPIAHIGEMANRAIVQANRNRMKQHLLNLVINNPTSLTSLARQWYVLKATGEWEADDPVIPVDADGATVAAIVAKHEAEMEALKDKGLAEYRRDHVKLGLNTTKAEEDEHKIRVMVSGQERVIYINGNPAAAQAVNGLTNPNLGDPTKHWIPKLINWAQGAKGRYSALLTSLNLAFVAANLSMDTIQAASYTAVRENAAYNRRALKNAARVFAGAQLPRLIHKWQEGELDMTDETERYFQEFMHNGGETGFTQLLGTDHFKKEIKRFVKDAQGGALRMPLKAWRALWRGVEYLNRCAEDTNRFICYMTSRQQGRDIAHSINDAKELTVNFNKKGAGGLGAGPMNYVYVFFNAAIQALRGFGLLIGRNPKRSAAMMATLMSAGMIVPLLNTVAIALCGGGDGDDDWYWNLPEWQRRNNLCLYIPWSEGKFLIIPLPHELRPIYGVGECALSAYLGKQEIDAAIGSAAAGFSGMLPVDYTGNGGNVAVNMTPSLGQPVAQVLANRNYFDRPVYREADYLELEPEHTKAFKGTGQVYVELSELINSMGGGDDVHKAWTSGVMTNPDVMEHLLESYLGGVGKLMNKSAKTLTMLWDEEARQWRNVPVASRFVAVQDDRGRGSDVNRKYWDYVKGEYEQTEHDLQGYTKQASLGSMEYAEKLQRLLESPSYRRYSKVLGSKKAIDELTRKLKTVDPSDAESVENAILDLKTQMMEDVENAVRETSGDMSVEAAYRAAQAESQRLKKQLSDYRKLQESGRGDWGERIQQIEASDAYKRMQVYEQHYEMIKWWEKNLKDPQVPETEKAQMREEIEAEKALMVAELDQMQ